MLLEYHDVILGYDDHPVVGPFSFGLTNNDLVWMIGKNGSGKSTILRHLVGEHVRLFSGTIKFRDRQFCPALKGPVPGGLAYVPQEGSVFPNLTLEEHFSLARSLSTQKQSPSDFIIDTVHQFISTDLKTLARDLSGGQSRLLGVLIAIESRPDLLILDEPFAGLAAETRLRLASIIQMGIKDEGFGALIVEHVDIREHFEVTKTVNLDA